MNWRMMVPFSERKITTNSDPFFTLQNQMNRMFHDVLGEMPEPLSVKSMNLDVKEDEKSYYVMTELPGMSKDDIELSYDDGVLTVRGEKKIERDEKEDTWHIVERSSGCFVRQLRIPTAVNSEEIEAKVEKGVLTITLPKENGDKAEAKKIKVEGE